MKASTFLKAGALALFLVFGFFIQQLFTTQTLASHGYGYDDDWSDWTDTSSCSTNICGSNQGTKTQKKTRTERVCDQSCPSVEFSDSRTEYKESSWSNWSEWERNNYCSNNDKSSGRCMDEQRGQGNNREYRRKYKNACPAGYTYQQRDGNNNDCYKVETFGPITVQYNKSNDPNKCHRPTPESLNIPSWARSEYNRELDEHRSTVKTNCRDEVVETRTRSVSCTIPVENVVACPIPTPTPVVTPEPTPTPDPCNVEPQLFKLMASESTESAEVEPCDPPTEPSPVPSPSPLPGKTSGLEITALSCSNRNFDVIIDLDDNNVAAVGVKVKFTYNGKVVERVTDAEGKARAGFAYEGDMSVKVEPEGFPGHDRHIELPKTACEAGVGGTMGEVLGTSTMAETGLIEDLFVKGLGSVGGILTTAGSLLYAKKKRA